MFGRAGTKKDKPFIVLLNVLEFLENSTWERFLSPTLVWLVGGHYASVNKEMKKFTLYVPI